MLKAKRSQIRPNLKSTFSSAKLGGDNHLGRYNDNHLGRWRGVEGGVAAGDEAPPASRSWLGFRMADRSLEEEVGPVPGTRTSNRELPHTGQSLSTLLRTKLNSNLLPCSKRVDKPSSRRAVLTQRCWHAFERWIRSWVGVAGRNINGRSTQNSL